jgi:hypothetical protein
MILMGIVQVSQLMIARIYVQYAAVAAARCASVWIPATMVDSDEGPNQIRDLFVDWQQDPQAGGTYYRVSPTSNKAQRIHIAAAQALMSVAPSRDTADGNNRNHVGNISLGAIQDAYEALVPASRGDDNIRRRLANKLAYSLNNTSVDIRILHPSSEPELQPWDVPQDRWQFHPNEIGFQDSITVTVSHNVALLPGPARLFARMFQPSRPEDSPSPLVEKGEEVVWPLSASATMGNEGQQSKIRYDHLSTGMPL